MDEVRCCCESFEDGLVSNCCPEHNDYPDDPAPGCICTAVGDIVAIKRVALTEVDPEILIFDGFDDAIIGYTDSWGPENSRALRAVYSYERCLTVLMNDGLSYEDAVEHFEFNTLGAYVGPRTPVVVHLV